ncbi:rCG41500, partial [Rattus norvegicus]
VGFSEFSSIR